MGFAGFGADLVDFYKTTEREAWNNRVAGFVAELALNSKSEDELVDFFNRKNADSPGLANLENGRWVIRLEGWDKQ